MKFASCLLVASCTLALTVTPSATKPYADHHLHLTSEFILGKTLPELASPAVVDIDASWLRSLPTAEETDIKYVPRFHTDGAVITRIEAFKGRADGRKGLMHLCFHIGLRRGLDKDITINYDLRDGDHVVGSGRIKRQNLDERETTMFDGVLRFAESDFDKLKADGAKPVLRVTVWIDEQP
jgi:hypothetical protein